MIRVLFEIINVKFEFIRCFTQIKPAGIQTFFDKNRMETNKTLAFPFKKIKTV